MDTGHISAESPACGVLFWRVHATSAQPSFFKESSEPDGPENPRFVRATTREFHWNGRPTAVLATPVEVDGQHAVGHDLRERVLDQPAAGGAFASRGLVSRLLQAAAAPFLRRAPHPAGRYRLRPVHGPRDDAARGRAARASAGGLRHQPAEPDARRTAAPAAVARGSPGTARVRGLVGGRGESPTTC